MEKYNLEDLLCIIEKLRSPEGCPWDREQTHETLKKCLVEECQEVLDAIEHRDDENLVEELGDVLLQVIMHAQIGKEEGRFTFWNVVQGVSEKMIRRHPHVFGDKEAKNSEEVLKNWEEIKAIEKSQKKLSKIHEKP